MIGEILIPALAVGATGLAFGGLLGFASIVFKVDKDERIDQIGEILPGANCGGCGYAGCSALAEAIVTKGERPAKCNLMTDEKNKAICALMGVEAKAVVPKKARLRCSGTCDVCSDRYDFTGVDDCTSAALLNGGPKNCEYGCIGLGSCVKVCEYGALSIKDDIAHIDIDKCSGCGRCTYACPKHLLELVPTGCEYTVLCSSKDKGVLVKNYCSNGCIGCKMCEKKCEHDAIHVNDNIAVIDYGKCVSCGLCAEVCPKKVIHKF